MQSERKWNTRSALSASSWTSNGFLSTVEKRKEGQNQPVVLPEPESRVKQAGCRRLLKEPTQTTTTGKQRKRRRRQNRRRDVLRTITKSIIVLVLLQGMKNNNSILERHCHTWVAARGP
jgi:hypothetical protein